jgi:hypothetical protein
MDTTTAEAVADQEQPSNHIQLLVAFEGIKEQLVSIRREIEHLNANHEREFEKLNSSYIRDLAEVKGKYEATATEITNLKIKVAQGTVLAITISSFLAVVVPMVVNALNTKIHVGNESPVSIERVK